MHRNHRTTRHTGISVRPGEIGTEKNASRLKELRQQLNLDLDLIVDTSHQTHRSLALNVRHSVAEPQTAREDCGLTRLMHPALPELQVPGEQRPQYVDHSWGGYGSDDSDEEAGGFSSDDGDQHEGKWQQRRAKRAMALVGPRVRAMAKAERAGRPVQETLRSIDDAAQIRREKMRYELAVRSVSPKRATIDTGLGPSGTPSDDLQSMQKRLDSMMNLRSAEQRKAAAERSRRAVPRLQLGKLPPRAPGRPPARSPPLHRRAFK